MSGEWAALVERQRVAFGPRRATLMGETVSQRLVCVCVYMCVCMFARCGGPRPSGSWVLGWLRCSVCQSVATRRQRGYYAQAKIGKGRV